VRWRILVAALFAILAGHAVDAQAPHAPWRTVETTHFRVHYPEAFAAWAARAARLLEEARARLVVEIGYAPPHRVDVLVMDPVAQPNGMALPFLGWPRMVLWTTPPTPESDIGSYRDWVELLAVHEDAHLVHLLRPSRNPLNRFVSRTLLPLGPLTTRSPRWVIEGYATLLEGRLTGSGRPQSDLRNATLRQWARTGQLPGYDALSGDTDRWRGGAMPYLAGSAFLEWLERRAGPESFRRLWARMTARQDRGFDAAFTGVFGDEPRALYGRFVAELTGDALTIETERPLVAGELWQRFTWTTGQPVLSPDGTRLAVVRGARREPPRLVVLSTAAPEEEEREVEARLERMLERDPEDVAPVRAWPLPREPLHVLPTRDGAPPSHPRWMPDGESLLVERPEPDADGVLHIDLFQWTPRTGALRRITRQAGIRAADPLPDGRTALAVRQRFGASSLVRVDLESGAIAAVTEPALEVIFDRPRVSPDGERVLLLRHRDGAWRAIVRPLGDGRETEVPTAPGATIAHPAWSRDGQTIFLSVGESGFVEVHAFAVNETGIDPGRRLTSTLGAALAPEPTPDGRALFFLSLEPHGLDLRRLALDEAQGVPGTRPSPTAPRQEVDRAPRSLRAITPAIPPHADRAYGAGRPELMPLFGGGLANDVRRYEAGVRLGDVVGRASAIGLIGWAGGEDRLSGAAGAVTWRGWPVALSVHAFHSTERRVPRDEETGWRGVEGAASWRRLSRTVTVNASGGAFFGDVLAREGARMSSRVAFGEARLDGRRSRQRTAARYGASMRLERGTTGGAGWHRVLSELEGRMSHAGLAAGLAWQRRHAGGTAQTPDLFELGGVESSLLPGSVLSGRILVPALPRRTAVGTDHERWRATVRLGPGLPLFYERHYLWSDGEPRGDGISLAGVEWSVATGPLPLVRLPAPRARVGVARVLSGPLEGRTRWWTGLTWRP
jgi:hypothetical protein